MESKTVRLHSDDGRWLELTVQGNRATACVNGSEPFSFSFENLGYVVLGLGYQAWGEGAHFNVRPENAGVVFEFQGPKDRGAAMCRMSNSNLREALESLQPLAVRASLI